MVPGSPARTRCWDEAWSNGTVDLAFEECVRQQGVFTDWSSSIDNKIVAVFGVASAIIGFVSALQTPDTSGIPLIFWIIAVTCWVVAASYCYRAYGPVDLLMGPNPSNLLDDGWLQYTPKQYKYQRMRRMGDSFVHNRGELEQKADRLAHAAWFTAGEILSLTLAVFLG